MNDPNHEEYGNKVHIMNHPLIIHKISMIRDKNTTVKEFRELTYEISLLMGYEATRDLRLQDKPVETPIAKTMGKVIESHIAIVPILRAGLGMESALIDLIPVAKVGHVGVYRDHDTLQPVKYYCKLPRDIDKREVIVLDPMLATGGSSAAAISFIKQQGAKNIKLMCIIGAPQGIKTMRKAHPDTEIFIGTIDEKLNEKGYIIPGLGDAGDRLFGTL